MTSRSFFKERELANLEKINAGVNKSTFNLEMILTPSLVNKFDWAAQKPERQMRNTCTTAWKVRKEISWNDKPFLASLRVEKRNCGSVGSVI